MRIWVYFIRRVAGIGCIFFFFNLQGQEIALQGKVVDAISKEPLADIRVTLEFLSLEGSTDAEGNFKFPHPLPLGEQLLLLSKNGYITKRFPVTVELKVTKDLGILLLERDFLQREQESETILLSDLELDEENGGFDNVSGLLSATKDVYLNAAAFDFNQTFFRPRGFNSEDGKLLINGIELNKLYTGRPLWSNWGGLNDVQRNQAFSNGLTPSTVDFGGLAGTTDISMRAAGYSYGGKFSYAVANRSYTGRAMGSFTSGLNAEGWAYGISFSRRFGEEGYRDGSLYESNSFFLTVEKKFNSSHSLNFTGFYTPLRRGKTSPNTQEVFDLKGREYNAYWGYQDGEIRNSRIQRIEEPVLMLNHYWTLSSNADINTNIAVQVGSIGNSRLDYGGTRRSSSNGQEAFLGGGTNPDPTYYQKLPNFFLDPEEPNYQAAYLAQQDFLEDGQIDWNSLYAGNLTSTASGGNSIYVLYEDRNEDRLFIANSILRLDLSERATINAKLAARKLVSRNYARVLDLLGGNTYLDVDSFSEGDAAQSNLLHPNRLVGEGDHFKYFYDLTANVFSGFAQYQFTSTHFDLFAAGELSQTTYQRTGFYQNGNFPENSLGASKALNFTDYGIKGGFTYKHTGRHLLSLNAAHFTTAPYLRNSFSNARQNNDVVTGLTSEKVQAADISYYLRLPYVNARLTSYYSERKDATEISFYYADGISGLGRNATTAFVQEVLTGINRSYIGGEFGLEAQIIPDLKLKAAAGIGEFIYSSDPHLYLTSDDFEEVLDYGRSRLKNYRLPGGPQRAYQLGFEYRHPEYWFISGSANFFSHAFLDVAPLTRTRNFATDSDGLPLNNYNETLAKELLRQEQFDDYLLVNLIGGKSWKVKQYYIGFFASVNNLFNTVFKTGGFEQSRNANYRTLMEDKSRQQPIFGPKYWWGLGTSYYAHIYLRF